MTNELDAICFPAPVFLQMTAFHLLPIQVLIFSQFRMVLDLLEDFMLLRQYEYERLDGSSKHSSRQDAIDRFNTSGKGFTFLLTTRAGGQGITLTAATTAVLFDSDWNPQSDLQAMARCHRIGQTEEVRVYRLVTKDTYEQKLFETSSCKYGLDEAVLGGNTTQLSNNEASVERIKSLLRHGVHGIVSKAEDGSESKQLEAGIDQILETEAEHRAVDSKANNTFSQAKFSINPNEKKEADVDNVRLTWIDTAGLSHSVDDKYLWDSIRAGSSEQAIQPNARTAPEEEEERVG